MPHHPAQAIPAPDRAEHAARAGQAHLDAARIGRPTPVPAEAARALARWDAPFRGSER